MFLRHQYYSQTELTKLFKISVKGVKQLIVDHQLVVTSKPVDLGEYTVESVYINKEDIDKLNLPKR